MKKKTKKDKEPESLLDIMGRDPKVKSFNKSISTGAFSVNVAELNDELIALHSGRKMRKIKTKGLLQSAQKNIINMALETQSYRSRAIEIQMKCFSVRSRLIDLSDAIGDYLSITYKSELRDYKTIRERDSVINSLTYAVKTETNSLQNTIDLAQYLIEDLDQGSFALLNIRKTLELAHNSSEV